MSESLTGTAGRLRAGADRIAATGDRLGTIRPDPGAFGEGGGGRVGDLGRDLFRHWHDAVQARSDEARRHADRLRDLADTVDRARHGYAEIDEQRRQPGVR